MAISEGILLPIGGSAVELPERCDGTTSGGIVCVHGE
jgi:hypothetical protein